MANPWESFGKIYCINLAERDDRRAYCRKIFEKLKIPVEFYRVNKHPNGGAQGCFESHINVIKRAFDQGRENVVIFEDDVAPFKINKKRLREVTDFLNNYEWDIFYLGLCPHFFTHPRRVNKNIYELRNSCTHAYILNRPYMDRLKDLKFDGTPIDTFYCHDKSRSAGIYPSLFYQNNFRSDIQDGASSWENFVQNNKPALMHNYELFIFYRFEYLAAILFASFCVLALIFGRKRR